MGLVHPAALKRPYCLFSASSVGMSPPGHKLSDAEGALLDEIAILARSEGPEVPIKDLELRLEDRGFTDCTMVIGAPSSVRQPLACASLADSESV